MVFVMHLRPAREARNNDVAHAVIRDLLRIMLHQFGDLGTRRDKRQVSTEHIPQLGKLVESCDADKFPKRSNASLARIRFARHCAQLQDLHRTIALPDTLLEKKYR